MQQRDGEQAAAVPLKTHVYSAALAVVSSRNSQIGYPGPPSDSSFGRCQSVQTPPMMRVAINGPWGSAVGGARSPAIRSLAVGDYVEPFVTAAKRKNSGSATARLIDGPRIRSMIG
jgi:hypothetical protein